MWTNNFPEFSQFFSLKTFLIHLLKRIMLVNGTKKDIETLKELFVQDSGVDFYQKC